jgi:hypothetical protein
MGNQHDLHGGDRPAIFTRINLGNLQFLGADGALYNGFGGLRGQGSGSDRNIVPTLGRDSIYGDNNYRLIFGCRALSI